MNLQRWLFILVSASAGFGTLAFAASGGGVPADSGGLEAMLGFELDFWDYATFATFALAGIAGVVIALFVAGLPGQIAIARKHPDAEAVKIMGYAGFLPVVPWIQAFIWAFKPTDIVDIRRFPKEEAKGIDEEIARLKGDGAKDDSASADTAKRAPGDSAKG